jgi:hypothetical protein
MRMLDRENRQSTPGVENGSDTEAEKYMAGFGENKLIFQGVM